MIKLLYFTDLHYSSVSPASRAESYGSEIKAKLQEIVKLANEKKVDAVLFGGDLFHRKHEVTMAETREMIELFAQFKAPVIGVLGSHDIAAYRADSKNNRAAGVMEAANIIQWVPGKACPVRINNKEGDKDDYVVISGAPHCKDYECPASYGESANKIIGNKNNILVWLTHGSLVKEGGLPYEHTSVNSIRNTDADILLNGHYHSVPWSQTLPDGKLIINCGSVGRTAKDDTHNPAVILLGIDEKKRTWKFKKIELAAAPHEEAFLQGEVERVEVDDEGIRKFADSLRSDNEDLQDEDLKTVIIKACEGKEKRVEEAVLRRLEL